MKKSTRKKLKAAFWLVFLAGGLWVFLAPHTRISTPSVTVKVQQPPAQTKTPPEEKALPEEKAQPQEAEPAQKPPFEEPAQPNAALTVPVIPEPHEAPPPGHLAKVAIVIDDMGADMRTSERAILLPASVTLSFLPYALRTREQAKEARDKEHEILLHMPMEPVGHENPGKGALLVDLPMSELHGRFDTALASFTGFDGVNNHMGSKFTAYEDGMTMVVDDLKERHLFFLDSRTSAQSVGLKVAREKGLPSIARDVFLDDDPSPDAIRKQLDATERVARHKGFAVAIGHPHETTISVLETWTAEAPKHGIKLVPLNDLVEAK